MYLTIAQEALRMVQEDIKNPPEDVRAAEITDKIKAAQMSSGESPQTEEIFRPRYLCARRKNTRRQEWRA